MLMKLTEEEKKARKREHDRKWRAANRERERLRAKKYRDTQPEIARERVRDATLKAKYGVTASAYSAMLVAQGGKCATCPTEHTVRKKLSVDHCHSTGKVRGLLCQPCNMALGLLKDNTDTLLRAVDYLKAA
jgi:hypothetical protein